MIKFLISRLCQIIFFLLSISIASFFIFDCIPGTTSDHFNSTELNTQSDELGYSTVQNAPVFYFSLLPDLSTDKDQYKLVDFLPHLQWNGSHCRFHLWFLQIIQFNFGKSSIDQQAVIQKIGISLSWTLVLQVPCYLLIIIIALGYSYYRTLYSNSKLLKQLQILFIIFHSIPVFWIASLLLLIFASGTLWRLLPANFLSVDHESPLLILLTQPQFFILPVLSLLIPSLAYIIGILTNAYQQAIQSPFWRRVKATGLPGSAAIKNEARPIALIPFVTWLSSIFPALIAGSLLVENIFGIPGMGRLFYTSIQLRDWNVVHVIILLSALFTLVGFLISDLLMHKFDPRIKFDH